MWLMKRAIFLALLYSDIFDYPLTKKELEKWEINLTPSLSCEERGRVRCKNNYYYLSNREKIIQLRQKRAIISSEKIILAEKTAQLLRRIPFIKMIAVTGALAMKNSDEQDDIDLLIITQKNRVWLTRFLATVILEFLGQRRRPKESSCGNKICLNMYLDVSKLKIPKIEQNLYSAHEVCQIKPIYNKDKIYEIFLISNSWVKRYLPKLPLFI